MKMRLIPRLLISGLLGLLILLFAAFLANIPRLHAEEGFPLIPALLSAEAMLFAIGLCAYGLYALLLRQPLRRMRLERSPRPGQDELPWAHNAQWMQRRVIHTAVGAALFLWFFALNWWAVLMFAVQDRGARLIEEPLPVQLLCAVLVLIGIITLWVAIRKTIQWFTSGRSVLEIETLPGRPGGLFRGTIRIGFKPKGRKPVVADLIGFTRHWNEQTYLPHEEERRVGGVRDATPFLEEEQKIPRERLRVSGSGTAIPVQFEIPRDVPSSGLVDRGIEVIWKIRLRATTPNDADFQAEFKIPIYGY